MRWTNLDSLRARSIRDPAWFWDSVVEHLGIPFSTPYDTVLDDHRGIPWTTWFNGGRTNLAAACCDRWATVHPVGRGRRVGGRGGHDPHLDVRRAAGAGRWPGPAPGRAGRRDGRRGGHLPAARARDDRCCPGGGQARRHVRADVLRLRRRGRAGAAGGRGCGRARHRRRLPAAGQARADARHRARRDRRPGRGRHGRRGRPHRRRRAGRRPGGAVAGARDGGVRHRGRGERAHAVPRLHVRHDRPSQGRRARPRRLHREDGRGGRVPDRHQRRRPPVLAHRPRLDHGPVADDRRAWPTGPRSCSTTARPTIPARIGCGPSSTGTGPPTAASARRSSEPSWPTATSPRRATTCRTCASSPPPASRGTRIPGTGSASASAAVAAR